jgi:predicted nucleotidyltransferase
MEVIVKKTREVGTSAGVLLPRSWLNKEVTVALSKPSKEKIIQDIMEYLIKNNLNKEVKGIYLYGSYARGDSDFDSDIDVLIITHKINKLINEGNYEILMVSEESFSKNLPSSLNYLSILKEAEVILNKELIDKYRDKKLKPNLNKIINEINSIYKINKDTVETCRENKMNIPDGVIYSIVLRLKELYLIECLLSSRIYYKKNFLKLVGEKAYSAYLRIKTNGRELNSTSPDELEGLLKLSKKWLKELKGWKKE